MRSGVVKSSYSQAVANTISEGKVREIYRALDSIGAIQKVGEANREGTLYQVFIPDEIEACRKFRAERKAGEPKPEVKDSGIDDLECNSRKNKRPLGDFLAEQA